MQAMLNLHGIYGLPLSVAGITNHLPLSKEMADHDRRREAMKKRISRTRQGFYANQEVGFRRNLERLLQDVGKGEFDGDLACALEDPSSFVCAARAA